MRTTQSFLNDKTKWDALWKRLEDRKKKILELYDSSGETADEILEGHSQWYSEEAKRRKEQFDAVSLHPSLDTLPPKK